MATYAEKKALSDQGLSYKEISKILGISRQAVYHTLGKRPTPYFRPFDESRCIYKGVRDWLNENNVSVVELVRRMGYISNPEQQRRIAAKLKGRLRVDKVFIDKIIQVTGMTYEQAFATD